ncbi:MAG: type II toxin-antitoxin system prevent-host-death family antitoxin [Arsenicicoccus sp.]|uniref:type II toxin-antitoxin system Phd/YefM family antitoxin n=1 Tax=Serinicoccus profundi TaxID=1078471 RepID=UPI000255E7D0|nr:type II toxin-antitoxin system prevent-host-death family antitoxin [Serinicoccus profundi]PZU46797.1 MAG: type II toxin-antitoxin system prevent-host-death family antitoxin [Arsenicicoccus sp.]
MEVTVQDAKTHLSRLLRRVEAGEQVVIRRGSKRVAVLVPAPAQGVERQIWGDLEGELTEAFDEPLDDFGGYET